MTSLKDITLGFKELDAAVRLKMGIGFAVCLALALLYSLAHDQVNRLEKRRIAKESEIAELLVLKQRYQEANSSAQRSANRLSAVSAGDSPAKLIEETGIKGKSLQVKPLKTEERNGFQEESADVRIEGLTSNEVINLLFKLEQGTRPATIRKALFKTRFEDPSRLDLAMTVSLQKGASPQ
jgi:general secretion pathway protein M